MKIASPSRGEADTADVSLTQRVGVMSYAMRALDTPTGSAIRLSWPANSFAKFHWAS